MKRYSPDEIALFIHSHIDLSGYPEREIIRVLDEWADHMKAGGFPVGTEVTSNTRRQLPDKPAEAGGSNRKEAK